MKYQARLHFIYVRRLPNCKDYNLYMYLCKDNFTHQTSYKKHYIAGRKSLINCHDEQLGKKYIIKSLLKKQKKKKQLY